MDLSHLGVTWCHSVITLLSLFLKVFDLQGIVSNTCAVNWFQSPIVLLLAKQTAACTEMRYFGPTLLPWTLLSNALRHREERCFLRSLPGYRPLVLLTRQYKDELVEPYKRWKLKYCERDMLQCHLVYHKSHRDWPWIEQTPPGARPATDRLCHDTANVRIINRKIVASSW
jgi:hypothetical protein